MLKEGISWYALDSKEYLLPPPCVDDSEILLLSIANKLVTVQHSCNGLLIFVLPKDTVTVDLDIMTLTGVHTYKKDKNNLEKWVFSWSKENMPPPEFLVKVKETYKQETMEFLSTLLNQDLEPNYRPKAPCSCAFPKLNRDQEEHNSPPPNTNNNTLTLVRMKPTYKRPRQ